MPHSTVTPKESLTFHWLAAWLVLSIVSVVFFPKPDLATRSDVPMVGSIATRNYTAPITFELPKKASQLDREKAEAANRIELVFVYNSDATQKTFVDFDSVLSQIAHLGNQENPILLSQLQMRLSPTAIHQLAQSASAREALSRVLHETMNKGVNELVLAPNSKQISLYQELHGLSSIKSLLYEQNDIKLIRDKSEQTVPVTTILPREGAIDAAFSSLRSQSFASQGLQSAFYEVLYAFVQPNVFYLESETQKRKQVASASVNPSNGLVIKGMTIQTAGTVVSQEAVDKLVALEIALQKEAHRSNPITQDLGRSILLLLLASFFLYALHQIKPQMDKAQLWGLVSISIIQILLFTASFVIWLKLRNINWLQLQDIDLAWLTPFVFAPALNTMLFGFRIGFTTSLFVALYLGVQASFDLVPTLVVLLVSLSTCSSLHKIRYRSQFITASVLGASSLVVLVFLTLLLRNRLTWDAFWPPVLVTSLMIFSVLALTSVFLIHLSERITGVTTHLTLMELADFHHPLLKRLSEKAPGSFHHSLLVGNLAEKAAVRIDADPLLTRVIALYHDIGKSEHPEFFTENQKRGENPHDPLDPLESAAVIRGHVTRGLDLAEEYRIPPIVSAGIPEHHGDNLIHYFFRKALQQKLDQEIPTEPFRYPGPRPQSKETALVMLADSIEAASRSLEEPDAYLLAKLVQDVLQTRLQEDQLRDSGLSIRDLDEIEIGFLQSLEGMYHTRIPYPDGVFISRKM